MAIGAQSGVLKQSSGLLSGTLLCPENHISGTFHWLRQQWDYAIFRATARDNDPLLLGMDLVERLEDASHLKMVVSLAEAGQAAFESLFHEGDHRLRMLANELVGVLQTRQHVISIEAPGVSFPWWMLWTSPTGEAPAGLRLADLKDGFWGYRHFIEQNFPFDGTSDDRRLVVQDRIVAGVHIDTNIDDDAGIGELGEDVASYLVEQTAATRRDSYEELDRAFKDGRVNDQIMYFWSHGYVNLEHPDTPLPSIALTDGRPISAFDLRAWMRRDRSCRALVFLNVCEGGVLQTLSFESFASAFIECGAKSLVGATMPVPNLFASQFAKEFFEIFFQGGHTVAEAVNAATRHLFDKCGNPLGLIFGSYRSHDSKVVRSLDDLDSFVDDLEGRFADVNC